LLANDTDADGDALIAQLVDGGGNGSLDVNADGSFSFKSGGSLSGDRTFTYRVGDGVSWSAVATVTISLSPTATAPPTPKPTTTPTPDPSRPGASAAVVEPIAPPPAGSSGGGSAGPGSPGPESGFTIDESFGSFDALDAVSIGGFEWAVPGLALSVPGLLLII